MNNGSGSAETMTREEALETFVRGRITRKSKLARTTGEDAMAVLRMDVTIKARGPASSPPKVALFLAGEEAVRCANGLGVGDLIEAVGDVGPQRTKADCQEVLVRDRVKLRRRAGGSAGAA